MSSKRKYPKSICNNPICQQAFIPHDRRQVYCQDQCRINYNNDKKNQALEELKYQQKLKHIDEALDFLYTQAGGDQCMIPESSFQLLKIDLSLGQEVKNPETGEMMRWYINYGIVAVGSPNEVYYYIYNQKEVTFFEY